MTNNALAFIALSNEYCAAIENCFDSDPREFVQNMLKVLPRIYIAATDLPTEDFADLYIDQALDEPSYDNIRNKLSAVFGDEDTYLEVFEEDMKYSDTPIASSISENLSDIFQVLYNFLETVRNAPEDVIEGALATVKEDFCNYWAQILCNVLRPLNNIFYNRPDFNTDSL